MQLDLFKLSVCLCSAPSSLLHETVAWLLWYASSHLAFHPGQDFNSLTGSSGQPSFLSPNPIRHVIYSLNNFVKNIFVAKPKSWKTSRKHFEENHLRHRIRNLNARLCRNASRSLVKVALTIQSFIKALS